MKVLYFAQAAELAGCREEVWETKRSLTAEEFWDEVVSRHPSLAPIIQECRIASDGEFLGSSQCLDPHREAAVIPPVSGG
jgi:molybdopterin converting factor small subunit